MPLPLPDLALFRLALPLLLPPPRRILHHLFLALLLLHRCLLVADRLGERERDGAEATAERDGRFGLALLAAQVRAGVGVGGSAGGDGAVEDGAFRGGGGWGVGDLV